MIRYLVLGALLISPGWIISPREHYRCLRAVRELDWRDWPAFALLWPMIVALAAALWLAVQ